MFYFLFWVDGPCLQTLQLYFYGHQQQVYSVSGHCREDKKSIRENVCTTVKYPLCLKRRNIIISVRDKDFYRFWNSFTFSPAVCAACLGSLLENWFPSAAVSNWKVSPFETREKVLLVTPINRWGDKMPEVFVLLTKTSAPSFSTSCMSVSDDDDDDVFLHYRWNIRFV